MTLKFIPALTFFCPTISKYEIPNQKSPYFFPGEKEPVCFAKDSVASLSHPGWAVNKMPPGSLGQGGKKNLGSFETTGESL